MSVVTAVIAAMVFAWRQTQFGGPVCRRTLAHLNNARPSMVARHHKPNPGLWAGHVKRDILRLTIHGIRRFPSA